MSILGDHRRFKKRFIPPLLASGMDFKFSNWVRGTVPEVFWIGVLLRTLGYGDGVAAALAIAKEAQDHVSDDAGLPAFAFARAYLAPTDTQISEIAERARVVADARRGLKELEPLFRVYPDYPVARLSSAGSSTVPSADDERLLSEVMEGMLDRRSRDAARVQSTAVYIAAVTGRFFWAVEGAAPPDLEQIKDYPDTDEARAVAAEVRTMMQGLIGMEEMRDGFEPPETWPASFWEHGLGIGECE